MNTKFIYFISCALALSACSSGTKINADGSPNGDLSWPDISKITMDNGRGIFPNLENLSNIRAGMTRDQLYELLGRPHFTEGFRVREWNYLFYFNTPNHGTNGVTTCEYKILFDKNKYAQNFFWKAIDPENATCPPIVKQQANINLGTDALFAFDRSDIEDITGDGYQKLDALANQLKQLSQVNEIHIVGYTDHIGSAAYNLALSSARAKTVRDYLLSNGVQANNISAVGKGETNPVVQCNQVNRQALVRCLAPNRRVEIKIEGYGVK